jgi:membrane peptidoglycan carboxypeptidase
VRGDGYKSLEGYLVPFYGATYPTRTWTAIMKGVTEGMPVEDFPPRANVDGKAPDSGHNPYTPPPPKPTKTRTTAPPPSTTAPPAPPKEPVANGVCDPSFGYPQDPDCPSPPPSPTGCPVLNPNCTPTPSPSAGRVTASREPLYARQEMLV